MVVALSLLAALAGCSAPDWGTPAWPGARSSPNKVSAWQAGDDIPGWEDMDVECPLAESAGQAVVWLPDLVVGMVSQGFVDDQPGIAVFITVADYSDIEDGVVITSTNAGPYVDVTAIDYPASSLYARTGGYGPGTERPDASMSAAIYVAVGGANDDYGNVVTLCLSRVRPDEMRGVIYFSYLRDDLAAFHYEHAFVEYPFEAFFVGSSDANYEFSGTPPEGFSGHSIGYGLGAHYDELWDWGAITDPDIRDYVYETYKPYNWP